VLSWNGPGLPAVAGAYSAESHGRPRDRRRHLPRSFHPIVTRRSKLRPNAIAIDDAAASHVYHRWYNARMAEKPKVKRNETDHSGSTFDRFLEQEGIREEVEAVAIKRVLAWQFEQAMREQQKTKQAMARQLRTSRSQLDRLLDPRNVSVTLDTITRAAKALGKRLIIRVADAKAKRA